MVPRTVLSRRIVSSQNPQHGNLNFFRIPSVRLRCRLLFTDPQAPGNNESVEADILPELGKHTYPGLWA